MLKQSIIIEIGTNVLLCLHWDGTCLHPNPFAGLQDGLSVIHILHRPSWWLKAWGPRLDHGDETFGRPLTNNQGPKCRACVLHGGLMILPPPRRQLPGVTIVTLMYSQYSVPQRSVYL